MEIQIISLLIALLAVIIGPFVTLRITNKNLQFQFRKMVNENWVNKLEKSAHSYLKITLKWIETYRALEDKVKINPSRSDKVNKEIDQMLDKINSSFINLELYLDKEKINQRKVLENIIEMKAIINQRTFNDDSISKLRTCHESIIETLKIILHEERTKTAKIFR